MSKASHAAYLIIRDAILDGVLPPGGQLTEEDLAERCAVSRTPVRDALRRLEHELFVHRSDSQRLFVTDWARQDLDEIYALRAMLEAHAASRAATRADADTIERLCENNARIGEAIAGAVPDVDRFLDLNRAYHALVLRAAGSAQLASMLARLVLPPVVHRTAQHFDRSHFARSLAEHEDVVAAIARRDAAWAGAVMAAHIRRAYHVFATQGGGLKAG